MNINLNSPETTATVPELHSMPSWRSTGTNSRRASPSSDLSQVSTSSCRGKSNSWESEIQLDRRTPTRRVARSENWWHIRTNNHLMSLSIFWRVQWSDDWDHWIWCDKIMFCSDICINMRSCYASDMKLNFELTWSFFTTRAKSRYR